MNKPEYGQSAQIQRQPLHEIVAGRIRDLIIEGELAPGEQVNEARLCAILGTSRTPIREAIRTLAGEGLIVLRPGRSTIVRQFSRNEVHDMLEVIAKLESLAARKACEKASDEQIAAIVKAHEQMMHYFEAQDRLPYYKLNQQIHSTIVEAAGNSALAEVHSLLQARMKRIRYEGHNGPQRWESAAQEHVRIIEAIIARDGDAAEKATQAHIQNTWERIKDDIPGDKEA